MVFVPCPFPLPSVKGRTDAPIHHKLDTEPDWYFSPFGHLIFYRRVGPDLLDFAFHFSSYVTWGFLVMLQDKCTVNAYTLRRWSHHCKPPPCRNLSASKSIRKPKEEGLGQVQSDIELCCFSFCIWSPSSDFDTDKQKWSVNCLPLLGIWTAQGIHSIAFSRTAEQCQGTRSISQPYGSCLSCWTCDLGGWIL